ncbi:MAG: DUF4114 domain-containing protein [Halothece sp.]
MVDVSITASPTLLIEEEETTTTLTIELSEPPPADGLIVPFDVSIDSGADKPLAQFDLNNLGNFEGTELLETPDLDTLNEFALVVQAQTARLTLPVNNDRFDEGVDEVTFRVRDTADFNIAPNAGEVTFTIADNAEIAPEPPQEPEQPERDRVTLSPEADPEIELERIEQPPEIETASQEQLSEVGLREENVLFDTLTSFRLTNVPEGESVEVQVTLPENQSASSYFNFDPEENNWFEFPQSEENEDAGGITIEDNQIILNLVDGGVGDLDGEANGEIFNIGNPVFRPELSLAPETDPEIELETVEQPEAVETASRNQLASSGLRENNLVFESLTSFRVTNVPEGEAVEVELTISENQQINNYFNFDPETDRWSKFAQSDENGITIEDRKITLNLVDGGRGDLDGEANGEITNIGNPIKVPEEGQITPSPVSDDIFTAIAPVNQPVNLRHEVTTRDDSNTVFEIGYTFLNEEQTLPQSASEKLEAVNNGASLFSVYPNTFENGEPGQLDFFNFGFRNASNSLERIISAENGDRIAYYLIEGQDVTSDTVNTRNIEQVQFDFLEVTEENNQFTLAGDNITFTTETANRELRTGTNLQAQAGLEVFDLTETTETVTATLGFDLISQAEFDNLIGFYTVQDQAGTIDTGNGVISPEEDGYTEAALANSRQNFGEDAILDRNAAQGDRFTVEGGQIMVPFILAQGGDLNEIPDELPEDVEAYFPYIGANSDGADHFRILADNTFGIEDREGGGDQDFNDIIFQLDFI